MIDELERPVRVVTQWQLGAAGVAVGALVVVLSRVGEPLGPLVVQAVSTLALLVISILLLATAHRVRGDLRDRVLAGTRALLLGSDGIARPARVVARGLATAHPGYLAGSKPAQDTRAVYLLLDVVAGDHRELAAALVPRQAGMPLRRGQVVGVQWRAGQAGVAVLDTRLPADRLSAFASHEGWQLPDPRRGHAKGLVLAALAGFVLGGGLSLVLALTLGG